MRTSLPFGLLAPAMSRMPAHDSSKFPAHRMWLQGALFDVETYICSTLNLQKPSERLSAPGHQIGSCALRIQAQKQRAGANLKQLESGHAGLVLENRRKRKR